jgi:hypothetical protein
VLQEFMPFLGVSPEIQTALIREMTGPGLEETASSFIRVHSGSNVLPDASDDYGVRKPMKDGWTDDAICPSGESQGEIR